MPNGLKQKLELLDKIGRIAENVALVVLFSSMMLLAVGQIVLREVFDTGIIWIEELIKLIVLWLAMVGSIAAARDNRHIRIDALSHVLSERARDIVRIVVDLFAAGVCGVLAWHTYQYLKLEIEWGMSVLIDTPAWLAHIIVPIAFVLVCYRFLVLVLLKIYEMRRGKPLLESPE